MRLLAVLGTRPEAVKLAPVIAAMKREPSFETRVCVTGQHRELVDSVLDFFAIRADFDLEAMRPGQALGPLFARLAGRLDRLLAKVRPERVIVQGDTVSALAAALAAFHRAIPVAHVEAGLRTWRAAEPWPEEHNRRAIGLIADLHFAPTPAARDNLLAERVAGEIFVTGNSGIDALDMVLARGGGAAVEPKPGRLVLVTAHRRESFGAPFAGICAALGRLAARGDLNILFPLHPNPALRRRAAAIPGVALCAPLGLAEFVALLRRADLVLTDSGGVQEEAVALGRPVLVLRDATERPEGGAACVGTDPDRIVAAATALLAAPAPARPSRVYGDGRAAERIVAALSGRPVEEFGGRIEGLRRIG